MVRNMEPLRGAPYVYGWKGRFRNWLLRRATAAAVRSAHRVVAVSHFVSDYLEQHLHVDPSRIVCIHHGRDTFFERDETPDHTDEQGPAPMFLTCGSLLPYRRCEDVIDAFALISKALISNRFAEQPPTLDRCRGRYRAPLSRSARRPRPKKWHRTTDSVRRACLERADEGAVPQLFGVRAGHRNRSLPQYGHRSTNQWLRYHRQRFATIARDTG